MENSSGMLRQQAEQLIARDDYGSLEIALSLLKLPDATSKSHAETLFSYCKNHYAPTLCVKLAYILRSSQLVKTCIQSQLDTNIKAQLKAILIESFLKETNREVAEGLRKLISAIALKFLPRNVWPELIDSIFLSLRPNFTPALNVIQESALLLFAELSPQLGEIVTNRIDELYNACPPNVKAAAVKALVYLVAFLADSSSYSRFPDLLNTMGFAAFTLISQNEYAHGVLEDLIMLVGSKPSFFFCVALKVFGYMSVTKWKGIRTEKSFKAELLTGAREFSYRELKSATRGFHSSRIVGYGAFFGTVYKAFFISTGTISAVKRSKHTHEGKTEFLAELSIIACLRHTNLVQLQGWCVEKDEPRNRHRFCSSKAPHDLYESYYNSNKSNLKLYVHQCTVCVSKGPSLQQLADIFTKGLDSPQFKYLCSNLMLGSLPQVEGDVRMMITDWLSRQTKSVGIS